MENFVYTEEVTGEIVQIPVKLLHHHHDNPRKDHGDLTELTESIKAKGVLQNLTVVPFWFKLTGVGCDDPKQQAEMGYLVVIGNRRLEAAKKAGLETLPCIIAKMTPAEQVQTMLLENMQRSDLTAYEQAQGFQMMLDFGDTVKTVAEKTGFSESTIRRRLEWAKLDADTMVSVSSRQISLMDLDRLSKIDNIETRNKVLCEIGTNNFENKLQQAIKAQEDAKLQAKWREALLAKGAVEVSYSDLCDYSKYEYCTHGIFGLTNNIEDSLSRLDDTQYYFSFRWDSVYLRKEKKESNELTPEQEEYNRREAERREHQKALSEAFARAYKLRVQYAGNLSETAIKKKAELVIRSIIEKEWTPGYIRQEETTFADIIGVTLPSGGRNYEVVKEATEANIYRALLAHALYLLGDKEDKSCTDYSCHYLASKTLSKIYEILCAFGYEMSDEEKELLDGTSELYIKVEDDDDYDEDYEEDDYDDFEDDVAVEDAAISAALDGEDSDDEQ